MALRTTVLPLGLGFSALLFTSPRGACEERPRPPVRVYTNEDLERVRPFRDQTGVGSVPADDAPEPASRRQVERKGRGEAYWRREAARVRNRVEALTASATEIEARLAEQREQASAFSSRRRTGSASGQGTAGLRLKLDALRRRIRAAEDDLADRARRDGALPGWLR